MNVLARERCARLLIGQGDDIYDPACWRPKGHEGRCLPIEEWTFRLEARLTEAVEDRDALLQALKVARYWIDPSGEHGSRDLEILDAAIRGR